MKLPRSKEEDLKSDVYSGGMNVASILGDKIPEFLKNVTEGFIRRYELIAKAMIQRQFELEQTINIANKANDANSYYSAVFKLFSKDFYKDTVKLVDKGEYSWLIDKSMEYSKISKFIEATGKGVMKHLPTFFMAYNIKEACKRASEGNYFGSCLKVAEVGLSFIPGLSLGYRILPTGINLLHDYLK